ncbi:MAG TPA: ABC transporter ATP-binding protein [Candidatus Merdenecus merdavium]|nr:ABC transporter ATP-binding protein [Candidatus Merdenecus merdavium]
MILEVKNVVYYYKANKTRKILDEVSYSFENGKMYAILGASGSGKTTFLSLLAGLDTPIAGEILYAGEDIRKKGLNYHRKNNISLVFQNYNLIDYLTPKENVMLGGNKTAEKLLETVGIPMEDWNRKILQLSGGQQQRVAIARALASSARVLLADEPTGNLDEEISKEIIKILLDSAHELGKCVIVVTHSSEVASAADAIIKINLGKITEEKTHKPYKEYAEILKNNDTIIL